MGIKDIKKLIHSDGLARQCMYCKRYELPNHTWIKMPPNTKCKLEVGKTSHGLCPECFERKMQSTAASYCINKFADKNKTLNYINKNLGNVKFIKLPLIAPWDSKDIRQWARATTNMGWDEISEIPYNELLIIVSNLWEEYQNIKREFDTQAKKNNNWYKMAVNCQKFDKYKIENLSDKELQKILNINSLEGAKWLFQVEDVNSDDVREAKRCLLKIWHPDINPKNKDVAHELTNIIGKCNLILNKAIEQSNATNFYERYQEEGQAVTKPGQLGIFEKMYIGLFNGEELDYGRLSKKYIDISNLYTDLINQSGEHELSIDFSVGNSIYVAWDSERGGYMSADGNFHPSDERYFKSFYKQSMASVVDYVVNVLIRLIIVGIDITRFSGSSKLYNMIKNNLENRAKEILNKNSSIGDVDWNAIGDELENMDLSQLQNVANEYYNRIMGIFSEYRKQYGDRLSNRKVPWAIDYEETQLDRTYPMIRTLKNLPGIAKRVGISEFSTEAKIKEGLYNNLRRQIEKSKRIYPIDNKDNKTYKIIESFYNKIDIVLKDFMRIFE